MCLIHPYRNVWKGEACHSQLDRSQSGLENSESEKSFEFKHGGKIEERSSISSNIIQSSHHQAVMARKGLSHTLFVGMK